MFELAWSPDLELIFSLKEMYETCKFVSPIGMVITAWGHTCMYVICGRLKFVFILLASFIFHFLYVL